MTILREDAARRAVLQTQVAAPGETRLVEVAERAALAVAQAEPAANRAEWAQRFVTLIEDGSFLPSVPTLANSGRSGQLAACFVLEVSDSIDSIYSTLQRAAAIQQASGGIGIEFSSLRPRGTLIEHSGGRTPGPIAFAELFAHSAHVIGLAGRRAGAHLAILRDDHPDIVDFVRAKREDPGRFPQMGLAIGVSDRLLRAARDDTAWELGHARGEKTHIPARELLHEIANSILATGNPTLLFLDRIEADNPTPALGALRATNPCGEQPLLSGESCVLGSLQLPRFLTPDGALDEQRLARATRDAVRFLDNALEVSRCPDDGITRATKRTRKLGLGVMGLADFLLLRGIPYDHPEARGLAARVFDFIAREAGAATGALAEERGAFPAWELGPRRRNATTRAFAPTGTLSLLAGCSAGMEPLLTPAITLRTDAGELRWTDGWLSDWLGCRTRDPKAILDALAAEVRSDELPGLSGGDRALLRRAWEISPENQLAMQAGAQRSVDGAVSKTVHLDPANSPTLVQLVGWIHHARSLGCKGVAFYRRSVGRAPICIDLRDSCVHSCANR